MARSLMIQGTCSNAGKSVIATGLCRILRQEGYLVAPFKAQNMSLNSFVTRDDGEMGRAQVTQALACGLEPDVRMNPVLLKPSGDRGCQVILHGRPIGMFDPQRYTEQKKVLRTAVADAWKSLSAQYDVIVLEGAGSPAEINLKADDIANMAMAKTAHSPVVIVGDIDRGGVFAHFVGTWELLDRPEQELTAGFIINKFRGDATQLGSAIEYVEKRTGRTIFGTVPWFSGIDIPDEDSVDFKREVGAQKFGEEH